MADDWAPDSKVEPLSEWAPDSKVEPLSPDIGAAASAWQGAKQGATFNMSDELAGAHAAGPEWAGKVPYAGPMLQTAIGAGKYLAGDEAAKTAYEKARDEERHANKLAEEQHPYWHGAGELAGSIPAMGVLPEAELLNAPRLIRPTLKAAQVGAEYAGLSGAGEGETPGARAVNAGVGAVTGGIGGGIAGAATHILGTVLGDTVGKLWGVYKGWKDPEAEASRRLGLALKADQEQIAAGDAKGMTAPDWLAAKRAGEPVTLADLGAGNTQALLRSAGNTSPEAWAKLENTFNERFFGQSERVANEARNLVAGGANAGKTADQLVAEYDAGRSGHYRKAFEQPKAQSMYDETLEQITQAPVVQNAVRMANLTAKNEAAKIGLTPMKENPFVFDANGRMTLRDPNFTPNLQYWDAVKKNLDGMGREGQQWAKILRNHLDSIVPEYGTARGFAANYFGESDALAAGRSLAGKKVDPATIIGAMRKMSDPEKDLFREGYASDWADRIISNVSDTRDITKAMFNSPNERARALAVFGQAGLAKMQTRMALETIMQGAKTAMGNSTTAKQLIEAGLAGGILGGYESGWDWKHIAGGAGAGALGAHKFGPQLAAAGARKIMGTVDRRTAAHVADLLSSSDITKLQQGIALAMKNKAITQGLNRIATGVALGAQNRATSAVVPKVSPRLYVSPQTATDDNQKKPATAGFATGGGVADHPGSGRKVHPAHGRAAAEKALPADHQLGMRVPKGGSSCSSCHFLTSATECGNKGFQTWNGSAKLPAPKDRYCCDLYEHKTKRAAGGAVNRALQAAKGYAEGGAPEIPFDEAPAPSYWDRAKSMLTGSGPIHTSTGVTFTPEDINTGMDMGMAFSGGGLGIKAYHGSPHDFDRFDLSKIGTGEGAQAYGHGLYLAESEPTAAFYREALTRDADRVLDTGGRLPPWVANTMESRNPMAIEDMRNTFKSRIAEAEEEAKTSPQPWLYPGKIEGLKNILKSIDDFATGAQLKPRGRMYEVDINADPEHFLDWDKPLNKQPEIFSKLPAELQEIAKKYGVKSKADWGDLGIGTDPAEYATGQSLWRTMARPSFPIRDNPSSPWKASGAKTYDEALALVGGDKSRVNKMLTPDPEYNRQALMEAGIPGIKYLDQGSRSAGEGSRNYVVFDDKLLNIMRKYKRGGDVKGYAHGGAPELSADDQAAMMPETFVPPGLKAWTEQAAPKDLGIIKGAAQGLWSLPQRAFEASENMRQGGDYNPEPILEAATLPIGTGAIAGVPLRAGESVLGSGAIRGVPEVASETGPVWRSAVEDTIASSPMKAAPAEQWAGTLKNAKGIKPEEMDWLGLNDFLASKAGQKVSKQELLDHVAGNQVELKDVVKGGNPYKKFEQLDENELGELRTRFENDFGRPPNDTSLRAFYENGLAETVPNISGTKFSSYQLPGGNNYREHLLTMPDTSTAAKLRAEAERRGYGDKISQWPDQEFANQYRQHVTNAPSNSEIYKSPHWDEPNVLAHVRSNDRMMESPGGPKKTLHLEEIQSDWHQKGRKQGYESNRFALKEPSGETYEVYPTRDAAERERRIAADDGHELSLHEVKGTGVPNAPFKDTDAWAGLAMKRMIRHAAENGYDRISWTPGEAQAARYDLSKQIDKVNMVPDPSGKLRIDAFKDNNKIIEHYAKDENEVADVVGKEVAKKLFENRNQHGAATVAGLDLKVGGEGMREFYDKMLPKIAEKVGKPHGVKVKQGVVKADNAPEDVVKKWEAIDPNHPFVKKNRTPVHYFDITPSLKQQALKGMSMFQRGGRVKAKPNHAAAKGLEVARQYKRGSA